MAASAVKAADTIGAACIIVLTKSGSTARYVSQCRPNVPIVAFTYDPKVARQLTLVRGVHPLVGSPMTQNKIPELTMQAARDLGFCKSGDVVVLLGSEPVEEGALTDNILT